MPAKAPTKVGAAAAASPQKKETKQPTDVSSALSRLLVRPPIELSRFAQRLGARTYDIKGEVDIDIASNLEAAEVSPHKESLSVFLISIYGPSTLPHAQTYHTAAAPPGPPPPFHTIPNIFLLPLFTMPSN